MLGSAQQVPDSVLGKGKNSGEPNVPFISKSNQNTAAVTYNKQTDQSRREPCIAPRRRVSVLSTEGHRMRGVCVCVCGQGGKFLVEVFPAALWLDLPFLPLPPATQPAARGVGSLSETGKHSTHP